MDSNHHAQRAQALNLLRIPFRHEGKSCYRIAQRLYITSWGLSTLFRAYFWRTIKVLRAVKTGCC